MKAIALSVVAIVAAFSVAAQIQKTVHGSGKKATRAVKGLPKFRKVHLENSIDLEVKAGPQSDLKITGDDNLIKLIKVEVKGDTLHIGSKENLSSKIGLKASFTSSSLTGIEISGSGDATVAGLKADKAEFAISGSGDIKAAGQANSVKTSIAGSGDIDLSNLRVRNASASIAGSGDIKLNVSDSLAASIAGSGDVVYIGKPKVSKTIVGSGDVRPR
jgi:hypothetical protein